MSEKLTQNSIFSKVDQSWDLADLGLTFNIHSNTDRNEVIPSTIKEWMEIGLFVVYFIDLLRQKRIESNFAFGSWDVFLMQFLTADK